MTYCLAIKVEDGLVCLADGRITAGTQVTTARKVEFIGPVSAPVLTMTSGLRSLRDKTLAYLKRDLRRSDAKGYPSMLDAVEAYCGALRRVFNEDAEDLERSKLKFNLHAIVAGKMPEDDEPTAYMVYPEGNWIEVDSRTPYLSIGETSYGKPILDRALNSKTDLATAANLAYLSFDSTRISAADVGFPIDLITFSQADGKWREAQYDYDDVMVQRRWWNENLTQLAMQMPEAPWKTALVPGTAPTTTQMSSLSLVREDDRK
ncbi:MAG: peptidase [Pseudomonadota bacterium]|nr:peptidase [Pseudomonadota bacterium]